MFPLYSLFTHTASTVCKQGCIGNTHNGKTKILLTTKCIHNSIRNDRTNGKQKKNPEEKIFDFEGILFKVYYRLITFRNFYNKFHAKVCLKILCLSTFLKFHFKACLQIPILKHV